MAPRILLVDDDRTILAATRAILTQLLPGARIDEAASAVQAVALLRQNRYALVLADFYMAWMDGIELLEVARDEQPEARRVLMTGRERDLAEEAQRRAQIHGFVPKPPTAEKLKPLVADLAP